MAERTGGYYGAAFKGDEGLTQGEPLSTTIFNVVVDAVVQHWVAVMVEGAEDQVERGEEVRNQNALFYVDDGMIASSDPQWIHGAFITLFGLFDRLGLQNNVGKTVSMVFGPCQAEGTQSEAAYGQRMTGEGPSYQERQK